MSSSEDIIQCGIEHADLLAEMHSRSFPASAWKAKDISAILVQKTNSGFIYCRDENPVGFILWQEVVGEAEVLTFCVDPSFRGLGFSKEIIFKMFEYFHQAFVKKVFLEVSEENIIAISLYRVMGFNEIARRSKYYHKSDGTAVDAVVMSVDI
ncbi:ribosomal protein S18-alanine N-acetyltransferase [Kiloniella spongiae]|uniref:ribosomal protein S18-alanine N-acetyltransferase n=1 Tax=Kiloniella spongiae TaxID=1489064 RepID=UPI000699E662|nr:ribosomal protein S18-alanine N-acetyltransferase [Kiloniella spongiae]